MTINPLVAHFADEAALVSGHSAVTVAANLSQVFAAMPKMNEAAAELAQDSFWPEPGSWLNQVRPYVVKDGVLMIPVKGVLLHDFPYSYFSYATGYEYIQKAFDRGMDDAGVQGIALIIDSPGGHVAGNFDLVDRMYARRGEKPVYAFAVEHAYSAAYSIASAADKITVCRTGGVGSIGVVTSHLNMKKWMEDMGLEMTFVHRGKHKTDGNQYEALSPEAKARIQSRIDALYDVFVATVARNRGMDEGDVRATEALTFTAAESLSNRLADAIGSLDDGLAAFAVDLNPNQGETEMSKTEDKAVDQATVDAARAEGIAEGVKAENARISGIMALEESKTRRESALNIALTSNMTVDQAKGLLATLPEAGAAKAEDAKPASNSMFDKAMAEGNPELGASAEQEPASVASEILSAYHAAGGSGYAKK